MHYSDLEVHDFFEICDAEVLYKLKEAIGSQDIPEDVSDLIGAYFEQTTETQVSLRNVIRKMGLGREDGEDTVSDLLSIGKRVYEQANDILKSRGTEKVFKGSLGTICENIHAVYGDFNKIKRGTYLNKAIDLGQTEVTQWLKHEQEVLQPR
ncbi:MAG: hypothetical protein ACI9S8_000841 [Chlamydiales bacterium]|jgi:hypothetical protein